MPALRVNSSRNFLTSQAGLLGLILMVTAVVACSGSGESDEKAFLKTIATDTVFSISDLDLPGVKMNKQYNVAELAGASDAWRLVSGQSFIEVRIYDSHEDAVELGRGPAESVTGKDAIVTGPDVVWQEGARDRRKCVPRPATTESGCLQQPRYGDFVTVGNVVLLCEGVDSESALIVCRGLMSKLGLP